MITLLTTGLGLVLVMVSAARAASIPPNFLEFAGDAYTMNQCFDCDGTMAAFTSGDTQIPYDSRLFYPREVYDPNITEPSSSTVWSIGQQVTVSWCVPPPWARTSSESRTDAQPGRETDDAPDDITNDRGKIVLGHVGDGEDEHLDLGTYCLLVPKYAHPNLEFPDHPLASGFDIREGSVQVQVPNVEPGDDYILVCKPLILGAFGVSIYRDFS